jgi:hypothetical protein
MSLINEALKRAREAQQTPQPTSSALPQVRPVEPNQTNPGMGLMPPLSLAVASMLALVVVWQWIHARRPHTAPPPAKPIASLSKTASARPPASAPQPARAAVPVPPTGKPIPVPAPRPVANKPAPSAQVTPRPVAPTTAKVVKPVPTPGPQVLEPEPKPIALNLQAIVYNPKRPSAMINGRTLFLGDHVGDFRVAAISSKTVTVIRPGKTNILILRD